MELICGAANATGAGLLQSDVRTPDIPVTEAVAECFKDYFDQNLHVNDVRAIRGVPLHLSGQSVIADHDIFTSEREMMRDPLYACLDRFGIRWWASVGFRSGSALWGLALQRAIHQGPFDAHETKALAQLAPQLTEAATLSKAVGRQVLLNVTNALHHMMFAAVALDRFGFVIEANDDAEAVFDNDIRVRSRRLFVRDALAKAALDALVDQMRTTSDMDALLSRPIIARRTAKRPVVMRVLPVSGAACSPFLGARVILALTDLERQRRTETDLIIRGFNLTPAEARLASLLATGMSLEKAAEQLGIARETARSQIKTIFAKTGAHRQGELVALLARL